MHKRKNLYNIGFLKDAHQQRNMPRKLKLTFPKGEEATVVLQKFTRGDVYGEKRRERRSVGGAALQYVSITEDGAHIVPSKGLSSLYLDESLKYVERNEVIDVSSTGEPLDIKESIFSTGVVISNKIPLEEYFAYDIENTYVLTSEDDLTPLYNECKSLIEQGFLYRFEYVYYSTAYPSDGILIPFGGDIVVGLGRSVPPVWAGPSTNVDMMFEEVEEESDDFDFEDAW